MILNFFFAVSQVFKKNKRREKLRNKIQNHEISKAENDDDLQEKLDKSNN